MIMSITFEKQFLEAKKSIRQGAKVVVISVLVLFASVLITSLWLR